MKNHVLSFILIAGSFIFGCQPGRTSKESTLEKPNFVFIFADDQCYNTIHELGNKDVITPNLDKMVESGVTFTHAFNMGAWNGAVCVASRTMINTGKSVWNAHQYEKNAVKGRADHTEMWGRKMEELGYDTYFTGKWHVKAPVEKIFKHVKHVRPGMPADAWDHFEMVENFEQFYAGKKGENYEEFMPNGYNRPKNKDDDSWLPTDSTKGGYWNGGKHWSEVLRDDAIAFIDSATQKDAPFFMYLAFNAPHDPRQSPEEYLNMYDEEQLSIPENFAPLYPEREAIGAGPSLRDAALAPFPRTEYATRVHLKEYYALITHLDEQIGQIMDALEKSGALDNTYIVYTADHGLAVGNHGLFGKQNMYDHSIRAPFIIIGPDLPENKRVDADIYLQDAMATALDLAGYQHPDSLFFNSVMPLAKEQTDESSYDAIYCAYVDLQRMIRKDGFKLVLYPEVPKVKLFNVDEDPLEMNNLAEMPKYRDKVESLFLDLLEMQEDFNDQLDLKATFGFLIDKSES